MVINVVKSIAGQVNAEADWSEQALWERPEKRRKTASAKLMNTKVYRNAERVWYNLMDLSQDQNSRLKRGLGVLVNFWEFLFKTELSI